MKDQKLLFYDIMNYPVPKNSEFFEYWTKKEKKNHTLNQDFSRKEKNKYLETFTTKINKFWNLYRSLPFISEIFLCNSITFNSLKEDSDIDIFIITKKNKLRKARFFSELYFTILWQKRFKNNKKQKFCLSFYTREDNTNLYTIMLKNKSDIYLWYRLAHLVPLYQETKEEWIIYKNNPRFEAMFPNHPQKYCINIWTKLFTWKSKFKTIIEFLFGWVFWKLIENLIKYTRKPILRYKTKKLWEKWKWIIVNDKMLKFYDDKRYEIASIFTLEQKN
jgi:predicted nucleotidyltransferase